MTTWNTIEKGTNVTLSNGNLTATNVTQTSSVKSTEPKTSGTWFCEVKVDLLNYNAIGIGFNDLSMNSNITANVNYFCYYSDGRKINGGTGVPYAPAMVVGDIIGVLVNFDEGELTFFKNGVNLGVAYNNIKSISNFCIMVSSGTTSNGGKITANFGATPFIYPPKKSDLPFNAKSYDGSQILSYDNKSFIYNNNEFKKWANRIPYQEINEKLHPSMLSGNSPTPYVVSASSSQGIYVPFQAFDGAINTSWCATYQIVTNQWIQINIGESKVANKVTMTAVNSTQAPKDFDVLGSNNGVDFSLIKEFRNQVGWTINQPRDFLFENNKNYSYYRVFVYNNNGSADYISLIELAFYNMKIIQERLPNWSTVSLQLPNSTQFSENGMESLSSLTRKVTVLEPMAMTERNDFLSVDEVGKVFSKTIDLKKYFDIRSIKGEVK